MPASRRIVLLLLAILLLLLLVAVPSVSWAGTLDDAALELARKIAAALPPHEVVVLNLRNLSSLTPMGVVAVRRALEAALQNSGLRLAPQPASHAQVSVTLSENLEGYLWVAEIRSGEALEVALVTLDRTASVRQTPALPTLLIHRELVWDQEEPILDVAFDSARLPQRMVVLAPSKISVYKSQGEHWQLDQSYQLTRTRIGSRDQRGRLVVSGDKILATLQGDSCTVIPHPTSRVECRDVKYSQPPDPGETIFDAGEKTPPWHSQASLEQNRKQLRIIAGRDGRARLYEDGAEPVATFAGWGSDLASIHSGCGSGEQLLVTGPGDWTEPDAVRAYEIRDREAVAVSSAVEFPGPVTALWPAESYQTAIAVARNLKTGRYEAYRLRISCGN